jgi:predicted metal-dependent phosphoesterase TrpH
MDDRNAPATKGDIADSEQRIRTASKADIADSEKRLIETIRTATKADIADSEQRLQERLVETMRDIETKLLHAFYGYAKTNDARVFEVEANESILRTRLATLESRIMEVERRLNTPPVH